MSKRKNIEKVKVGMSKDDVVALLGKPHSMHDTLMGGDDDWFYYFGFINGESVMIKFSNNKVVNWERRK